MLNNIQTASIENSASAICNWCHQTFERARICKWKPIVLLTKKIGTSKIQTDS